MRAGIDDTRHCERWSPERRDERRAEYARNYSSHHAGRAQGVTIPDDITVKLRDPSPCFRCGAKADLPCRHRPWLAETQEPEVLGEEI